jgi:hypothetical protein
MERTRILKGAGRRFDLLWKALEKFDEDHGLLFPPIL